MINFIREISLYNSDLKIKNIAGIDEVGRGPWAGPVTACAVILDPNNIPNGLNDSKKISLKQRNILYDQIISTAKVGISHVSVKEIDAINILNATMRAMENALLALSTKPDFALIDGNKIPQNLACPAEAIIKGDAKSVSIAAASIVAKVTRDRLMADLAQQFPGYGWETNAGYGTKIHQIALKNLGVTPHHRRSFKPIHNILCKIQSVSI